MVSQHFYDFGQYVGWGMVRLGRRHAVRALSSRVHANPRTERVALRHRAKAINTLNGWFRSRFTSVKLRRSRLKTRIHA